MNPERLSQLETLTKLSLMVLDTDRSKLDPEERDYAHVILTGSLREIAFEMAFKSLEDLKKEKRT